MADKRIISFCKMHGLGNDFMLIDGIRLSVKPEDLSVQAWADRHTGVGFDQLLLLMPSSSADAKCLIFNSDGSEAEQCGNGMRCVALYLHESGITTQKTVTIETRGGTVQAEILPDKQVQVTLGIPVLDPGWIDLEISSLKKSVRVFALSIGNPHAILQVDALQDFPVTIVGQEISTHRQFPSGVNAGFMQVLDRHRIALRTVERGAGETLSCGSNACAAAVAGILNGQLISPVAVQLPLGTLNLTWDSVSLQIKLGGPAAVVFSGEITS